MPYTPAQRRQLEKECELHVPDFTALSAAEEFRRMAEWCDENGIQHDHYGQGRAVEAFEQKIATLLGLPAAVLMPSGVMAQLAAVRVWTEKAGLPRFGMHPTSHLASHEEQAYSALMHCHGVPIGDRLRPMLASDLEADQQAMACLLVELPIREAGGQLPTWDELEALKAAARQRGIALHMDGARLWESAAFYGKPYAEIVAGFDSVYVSLYKGIGGFAGAVLAGGDAFIADARRWRRRMGGTLYHLSPFVVSAVMRFDERLALMPALYQRTLSFAAALSAIPGLRVNPRVPQTNMLHLYFDAPRERVLDARDELAADARCWLVDNPRPAEVPGWCVAELYVGDRLLGVSNERVVPLFERLCAEMKAG